MKICIVDGYSTGAALARRLHSLGIECIHLQSQAQTNSYLQRSFKSDDYTHDLGHCTDTTALTAQLTALGVGRIIAGSESGVTLAETLALQLGLPTNSPDGVAARRDKALMARAVRAAGLAVPLGTVVHGPDEAADWFTASGLDHAVVKPLASAATDGVRFCTTAADVRDASAAVLDTPNVFGQRNTAVLVQERLIGEEYYLNTVSAGGDHRVAEIWHYSKQTTGTTTPIYDYEEPVTPDSPEATVLREFTLQVLDALGITDSAGHTEVMLTARGPVLIESAARLGGATAPAIVEKHLGTSQTSLLAATLGDPGALRDFDDRRSQWRGRIRNVEFINHVAGLASATATDKIASLPSAVAVCSSATPGAPLEPTRDLISSPGYVYLAAEDDSTIHRDYATLRQWEREGLHIE